MERLDSIIFLLLYRTKDRSQFPGDFGCMCVQCINTIFYFVFFLCQDEKHKIPKDDLIFIFFKNTTDCLNNELVPSIKILIIMQVLGSKESSSS